MNPTWDCEKASLCNIYECTFSRLVFLLILVSWHVKYEICKKTRRIWKKGNVKLYVKKLKQREETSIISVANQDCVIGLIEKADHFWFVRNSAYWIYSLLDASQLLWCVVNYVISQPALMRFCNTEVSTKTFDTLVQKKRIISSRRHVGQQSQLWNWKVWEKDYFGGITVAMMCIVHHITASFDELQDRLRRNNNQQHTALWVEWGMSVFWTKEIRLLVSSKLLWCVVISHITASFDDIIINRRLII